MQENRSSPYTSCDTYEVHRGKGKRRRQLGCYLRSDGAPQTLPSPFSTTLYKVPVIYPSRLTQSAPQHEWTQVPDVPQAASEGNHGTDLGPYFWHHWTGRVVCRQAGIPWSLIKTPYRLFLRESWSKQPRSLTFPHQAPLLYSQIYQTHLFIQGYFCIPTSVHEPEEDESHTVLSLKCFYSSRIFLNPLIHSFNKYDSAPTVCHELCKC